MSSKQRVSATADVELVEAGQAAVAAEEAESLSAWVNDALRRQADRERRLRALDDFLASYEAEHGASTADGMRDATRRARGRAIVVRDGPARENASPAGPL